MADGTRRSRGAQQWAVSAGSQGNPEPATGADIALRVLRLGKIELPSNDAILIDADDGCRSPVLLSVASTSDRTPSARSDCLVEDDIMLQDLESDEDSVSPTSLPTILGRFSGRRLMQARAQQCMVCMDEKEHTLVPVHHGSEIGQQHVEGHRFCSDCWAEYLRHSRQQYYNQKASNKPMPLTCPLCRSAITVPDVWSAQQDLPPFWMGKKASERRQRQEFMGCFTSSSDSVGPWVAACHQDVESTSSIEAGRYAHVRLDEDTGGAADLGEDEDDVKPPVPACRWACTAAFRFFRVAFAGTGDDLRHVQQQ